MYLQTTFRYCELLAVENKGASVVTSQLKFPVSWNFTFFMATWLSSEFLS